MRRSLFALVLAAVTLDACSHPPPPKKPPPTPVQTVFVRRASIATYVSLDGQIAPFLQSTLSSQQSGAVTAVYVSQGDRVHAGQLLAKIDDAPLRAQLVQAQGQYTQASAHLTQSSLQHPITSQSAYTSLEQSRQTVVQARNALVADEATVQQTRLNYQAAEKLLRNGYVSESTYQAQRQQYVAAVQARDNARHTVTQDEAALKSAQQNLGNIGVQSQDIAANRGSLQQQSGTVQLLQTQIAQTSVSAPFDGYVTARYLDPGAYASPNQPIVQVSQVQRVYVNFNLPDADLAFVRPGVPVTFTTASVPGRTFGAKVSTINTVPTPGTLVYRGQLALDNQELALRGGMLVAILAQSARHDRALVVPRAAVQQSGTTANVFAVTEPRSDKDPPTAKKIAVTTGLQTASLVEIGGRNVRAGMRIVTTRPDSLQNGGAVSFGRQSASR